MPEHLVGLISDTHGLVRPAIARVFDGVSRILHAGDVGGASVLRALEAIAPVDAVFGNVDDEHDPMLARERLVTIDRVTIHISHGHELGRPTPALVLARYTGDIVMFGHTHRAALERDGLRIAINPGAAGPRRFDIQPSVALLTIDAGQPHIRIISLT